MSNVDLKALLSKPSDEIKTPVALPDGTYFGIVKSQEFGKSKKKQTPFCRYNFSLTGAGDDVDQSALEGVDLSKKELRTDFYLTEDSLFRLKDFLSGLGIQMTGRSIGETIPEAVGQAVILTVTRRYDENDMTKVFNDVSDVKGSN